MRINVISVHAISIFQGHTYHRLLQAKPDVIFVFPNTQLGLAITFTVKGAASPLAISFCEYVTDNEGTIRRSYIENMGSYSDSNEDEAYHYTTIPLHIRPEDPVATRSAYHASMFDSSQAVLYSARWHILLRSISPLALRWLQQEHLKSGVFYEIQQPPASSEPQSPKSASADDGFLEVSRSFAASPSQLSSAPTTPSDHQSDKLVAEAASQPAASVDIIHQVGTWFHSTRLGQFISNAPFIDDAMEGEDMFTDIKVSPFVQSALLNKSPIYLLGTMYSLISTKAASSMPPSQAPSYRLVHCHNVQYGRITRISPRSKALMLREILICKEVFDAAQTARMTRSIMDWLSQNGWTIKENGTHGIAAYTALHGLGPKGLACIELIIGSSVEDSVFELVAYHTVDGDDSPSPRPTAKTVQIANACVSASFIEILVYISQKLGIAPLLTLQETRNCSLALEPEFVHSQDTRLALSTPRSRSFDGRILLWSDHIHGWILQRIAVTDAGTTMAQLIDSAQQISISHDNVKSIRWCSDNSLRFSIHSGHVTLRCRSLSASEFRHICAAFASAIPELLDASGRSASNEPARRPSYPSVKDLYPSHLEISRGEESSAEEESAVNFGSTGKDASDYADNTEIHNLSILEEFLADFRSRFHFTYRKGFPRIAPTLLSTDLGWGCMLRSGQSLIAEAFSRCRFGRGWRLSELSSSPSTSGVYASIVANFLDTPTAPLSVHQMAELGSKFGVPIGEWFSPSILARVIKYISTASFCRTICNKMANSVFKVHVGKDGIFSSKAMKSALSSGPLVALFPVRLGMQVFNPIYTTFIKSCLMLPHSIGIAGGKPSRSLYFVGHMDDELIYLDPHYLKQAVFDFNHIYSKYSFHTSRVGTMPVASIDPSMLVGFIVFDWDELVGLRTALADVQREYTVLSLVD